MKSVFCICLCLLLACGLVACDDAAHDAPNAQDHVFEAVVKEVNEDSILVLPVADFKEANAAMDVGIVVMKSDKIPAVKGGDRVRIEYDGTMTRSIPPQLGEVYSFEVIH